MSQPQTTGGIVTETIRELLPTMNAGFNWSIIEERFDPNPVGTAMSLHFTGESGEEAVEEVTLGITEGPKLVVLDGLGDNWDYLGAIVTYQDFGVRMLDPDDEMTPNRARYAHGAINIHPGKGKSKERTWLVVSNVLEIMLDSVIYESGNSGSDDNDQDDDIDNPRSNR